MNRLYPPFIRGNAAGGLLLLRLVAGSAFVMHGLGKIKNPMHWMGADASVPGIMQAAAAVAEFGGGIAWILGLLTPIACLGIICTMVTAISTVHLPRNDPFVNAPGAPSYELPLLYLCIGLTLLVLGPGTVSIDALIFGRRQRRPVEPPVETPAGTA